MSNTTNLTKLGKNTNYEFDKPDKDILETFTNLHQDTDYLVPFVMPEIEFTSLCPVTGQPDWAKVEIVYVPNELMIESKSLKLYLYSFRNHGEFHEDCMNRIAKDIIEKINPKALRVYGDFNSRGGIAIKPLVIKGDYEKYEYLFRSFDRK